MAISCSSVVRPQQQSTVLPYIIDVDIMHYAWPMNWIGPKATLEKSKASQVA